MLFNYSVILFLSVAALGQDTDWARTRQWGKQSGSFQLSISSDKVQYSADDVIHITAVLRNVTDHPTILVVTSPVESYEMDVRLPMAEWIPWKPQALLTVLGRQLRHPDMSSNVGTLADPAHERVTEYEINKLYNMSQPGEYRVAFSCRQPLRERSGPSVTIISNEIVVTVLPSKQ